MTPLVIACLLLILETNIALGNEAPVFTKSMDGLILAENVPPDSKVFELAASDDDPTSTLTFSLNSVTSDLLQLRNGNEIFVSPKGLDYESTTSISALVGLSDGQLTTTQSVIVTVTNIDEAPLFPDFTDSQVHLIDELSAPNTVIIDGFKVIDPEGRQVTLTCEDINTDYCKYFRLSKRGVDTWNLLLAKSFDYENVISASIALRASDGKNVAVSRLLFSVIDRQDTPPRFTSRLSVDIDESTQKGDVIMQMEAIDSDVIDRRSIFYSLVNYQGVFFRIDSISGEISAIKDVDREQMSAADFLLQVKASEMLNGQILNTPDTNTVVSVKVNVKDQNDNAPTFSQSVYTFHIEENIPPGSLLSNTRIVASDADAGDNRLFDLEILQHRDLFDLRTSTAQTGVVTAYVTLRNNTVIDYEKVTKYTFQIVARETATIPKLSSTATVVLHVIDLNDNKPKFSADHFAASVSETAPSGTHVITIQATDADATTYNGQKSLVYRLEESTYSNFFSVNPRSGKVTVATCSKVAGESPCLDFEEKSTFDFLFTVADSSGEGWIVSVPLKISLLDENDNKPKMAVEDYYRTINEGDSAFSIPLVVVVTDRDSSRDNNNVVSFSLISQTPATPTPLFSITSDTGVVTPLRGVAYPQEGVYRLVIRASDPDISHSVTGTAHIRVIDMNDHSPVFTPTSTYEKTILETTPPGTRVLRVSATDLDIGENGQVRYRVTTGAVDQFTIDPLTGVIFVSNESRGFDYDLVNRYEMKIVATDQGQPQRSSNAVVIVNIRDANNKNPYFSPATANVDIYEDVSPGFLVITMNATDPDLQSNLVYSMPVDEMKAFDPQSNPSSSDFKNLFTIESDTGKVRVQGTLDFQKVATFKANIIANDSSALYQSATASLTVNVIEVNREGPVFLEVGNLSVIEGSAPGTYVRALVAVDTKDAVSGYVLLDDADGHFSIDNYTGVVKVKEPLDYETLQSTKIVVQVSDNGHPVLSSMIEVPIQVINVNDENPVFSQPSYQDIKLAENSPENTFVVYAEATDRDLGSFGELSYSISDPENPNPTVPRFVISDKGLVYVAANASIDFETTGSLVLTVTAFDSPGSPLTRRTASASVYVTVTDANDNAPQFTQDSLTIYRVTVATAAVGSHLATVQGIDADSEANGEIIFSIDSGNEQGYFRLNQTSGEIATAQSLVEGNFTLWISLRDLGKPSLESEKLAKVRIVVMPGNNHAPQWIIPNATHYTFSVYENSHPGQRVFEALATDDDPGPNGRVTYWLLSEGAGGTSVSKTKDFAIDQRTGQLTTSRSFDRETTPSYGIFLIAMDSGFPSYETNQYVTIQISDIDDNLPEFPTFQNCCTIDYQAKVAETASLNSKVIEVKATDLDEGANAVISYAIIGGDVDNEFKVNSTTGVITIAKNLNYGKSPSYVLLVQAVSNSNTPPVKGATCAAGCDDPSIVRVLISVVNQNTSNPVFGATVFNTCVSVDAAIGQLVTILTARDGQGELSYSMVNQTNYHLDTEEPGNAFFISSTNGSVFTRLPLSRYADHYFKSAVTATSTLTGLYANTDLRIWVTRASQEVTLTFQDKIENIQPNLDEIISIISDITNGGIVCISDLRYHITDKNIVNTEWSDLILYVMVKGTLIPFDGKKLVKILKQNKDRLAAYHLQNVKLSYAHWDGFWVNPVLAALIIIAILVLLALLLFCCCCWCCATWYKKQYAVYHQTLQPLYPLNLEKKQAVQEEYMDIVDGNDSDLDSSSIHAFSTHTNLNNTHYSNKALSSGDIRIEAKVEPLTNGHAAANQNHTQTTTKETTTYYQQGNTAVPNNAFPTLTGHGPSPPTTTSTTTSTTAANHHQQHFASTPQANTPQLLNASTLPATGMQTFSTYNHIEEPRRPVPQVPAYRARTTVSEDFMVNDSPFGAILETNENPANSFTLPVSIPPPQVRFSSSSTLDPLYRVPSQPTPSGGRKYQMSRSMDNLNVFPGETLNSRQTKEYEDYMLN